MPIELEDRQRTAPFMNDILHQPLSLRMRLALLGLAQHDGESGDISARPKQRAAARVELLGASSSFGRNRP